MSIKTIVQNIIDPSAGNNINDNQNTEIPPPSFEGPCFDCNCDMLMDGENINSENKDQKTESSETDKDIVFSKEFKQFSYHSPLNGLFEKLFKNLKYVSESDKWGMLYFHTKMIETYSNLPMCKTIRLGYFDNGIYQVDSENLHFFKKVFEDKSIKVNPKTNIPKLVCTIRMKYDKTKKKCLVTLKEDLFTDNIVS